MKRRILLSVLREERNMSQRELARQLNVSCGTIGMYETGKRTPPLNRAIQIANLFNVPVETIAFSGAAFKMDDTDRKEAINYD